MTVALEIVIILFTSVVIFKVGDRFATASSHIGDYLRMPRSVKGATLDAISSSFPELMIALFSVVLFKQFDVGLGTIAGSALFNLLLIPAVSILVAPTIFKVSEDVIKREGVFYIIATFALLAALIYSHIWTYSIPIIFLALYGWYLTDIVSEVKSHRQVLAAQKKSKKEKKEEKQLAQKAKQISIGKEVTIAIITMGIIAVASYYLTDAAITLAENIGVSPFLISFTVIAAATSIPDAVISIVNAKKGQIDDSLSNVLGSNIFNILAGLSIPLLIAIALTGPVNVGQGFVPMVLALFGATILIQYLAAKKMTLTKTHAVLFIITYIALVFFNIHIA